MGVSEHLLDNSDWLPLDKYTYSMKVSRHVFPFLRVKEKKI